MSKRMILMHVPYFLLLSAAAFLGGCQMVPINGDDSRYSVGYVTPRTMMFRDVKLRNGSTLPEVTVAYQVHGHLNAAGTNAILVMHGNTANYHVAGRYAPGASPPGIPAESPGWWSDLIGPGKAMDTAHYFVVSSAMLGGSWGTTGPRSIKPGTGKPYGPDFPEISLEDVVAVQREFLTRLGVRHLVAVAGGSYGGALAFQWGITYPDMMEGLVIASISPTGGKNPQAIKRITDRLAKDPNWNGGRYYDQPGGMVNTLMEMRVDTLNAYGLDKELAATIPDPAARAAEIRKRAEPWAQAFDANSLVVQRKLSEFRDHTRDFQRIKAKVLYVLSTTDSLVPPSLAPKVMADLKAAGVDATYFELVSDQGHSAYTRDATKWAPALRDFLSRLSVP